MKIAEIETKSLKQFLESISQTPNSSYNLSNLFSVVNKGEKSYFNLSKTINFTNIAQIPEKYYTLYKVQYGDTWTNISYRTYGTIKAWWIICKFNNIKNPFLDLIVGKTIKLPTPLLLQQINNILTR